MTGKLASLVRPILKLRILLPCLIGLLSIAATTLSYYANLAAIKSTTIQAVTLNIKYGLTRTQGVLELIANTEQAAATRKIVASFSAQPDMLLTIVTNEKGRIIASTSHLLMDSHWQHHQLELDPSIINEIVNEHSIHIATSTDQRSIDGYISICPQDRQILGQIPTNQCSFLMQRLDLNYHVEQASLVSKRQAIFTGMSIVVLACFIGFFLHILFAKRSERLAKTVYAFTQGRRQIRSQITGQDEISLIAAAVDQMLDQIEQNEAELTAKTNRLNALFNTVIDPIIVTDGTGVITSCNNAAYKVFNYDNQDLLQRSIYTLLPELFDVQNQKSVGLFNLSAKRLNAITKSQQVIPIELTSNQMNIDGKVEQITVLRDITERVHSETELKQHRDNLAQLVANATTEIQAIVQTAVNAVITIDKLGTIQIFNPAAERMFGWSCEQVCGQNVSMLMPDIDAKRRKRFIEKYLRSNKAKFIGTNREIIAKRKDGSNFPAHLSVGHSKLGDDKHLFVAFIADISRQKATEQELRSAKEKAEQAAHTKAEFMANMSHEIRTPMNAIIGFSEILLQDKNISPNSQQFTLTILDAGKTLLRIINDVLDFTKIEAGKLIIEKVPFNLTETINNAVQMLHISAKQKQLALIIEIDENVPEHVIGDPTRLRQVLTNLLSNAIKFTQTGHVAIKLKPYTLDNQHSSIIQFAIEDTGIGMTEKQISTIFDPFAQGDTSTNRRFGGTGLGTTISKEIVELMQGAMWVKSQPEQGSTFYFSVDLPTANNSQKHHSVNEQISPITQRTLRVLLAEDVAANAQLVILKLEQEGHQVVWVTNGQSAMDQVMNAGFDLLLIDIQMPQVDGTTFTRAIRQYEKDHQVKNPLPIIALTGNVKTEDQTNFYQAGFNQIIHKPINFKLLLNAMNTLSNNASKQTINAEANIKRLPINQNQKEMLKQTLDQLIIALDKLNPDFCQQPLERLATIIDKEEFSTIGTAIDDFDFITAKELTKLLAKRLDNMT